MITVGAPLSTKVPARRGLKALALLTAVAGVAAGTAQAAPASHVSATKPVKEQVTPVAVKDVETTSSVRSGDGQGAYCDVSRKRLFVEGEGWIVRRVTTCY